MEISLKKWIRAVFSKKHRGRHPQAKTIQLVTVSLLLQKQYRVLGGIKRTSGPLKFFEASFVFGNIISEYKKDSLVP